MGNAFSFVYNKKQFEGSYNRLFNDRKQYEFGEDENNSCTYLEDDCQRIPAKALQRAEPESFLQQKIVSFYIHMMVS